MNTIDSIIFDLGGVILNLRHASTIEAFSSLCGLDSSQLTVQYSQSSLFDNYEMGRISSMTLPTISKVQRQQDYKPFI